MPATARTGYVPSARMISSSDIKRSGILALEDGSVFHGQAFGGKETVVGEAVFNTSMTGYQEILTDPSYYGQIIAMTAPQIGNYGISPEDMESDRIQARGFIVKDLSPVESNWRSTMTLPQWLEKQGIPAVNGIDTRALTKKLRVVGAMKACLSTEGITAATAIERAREWSGLLNVDYVKEVTTPEIYQWKDRNEPDTPFTVNGTRLELTKTDRPKYRVAAIDLGAKYNIFRKLAYHGFDVTVFPAHASFEEISEIRPQGIFLSNGPGDPSAVDYVHQTAARLIEHYPTFGICMGNQILTHALGAETFKLKFGHRGANQPVKNTETGKVSITSQNHGFAASSKELQKRGAIVTEINLNDSTVEGLRHKDLPVFSVQYHPEASPGPHDSDPLFDDFYKLVEQHA